MSTALVRLGTLVPLLTSLASLSPGIAWASMAVASGAVLVGGEQQGAQLADRMRLVEAKCAALATALEEAATAQGRPLSPAQQEQLAEIVSHTFSREDAEWLAMLRRAGVNIVRENVPAAIRHNAVRLLRDLTPQHVRMLRDIADPAKPSPSGAVLQLGHDPSSAEGEEYTLAWALLAAGLVHSGGLQMNLRISPLGRAVLRLLDEEPG